MITWTDVANLDAALVAPAVPVAAQTAILALVYRRLNATRWGTRLDDGALFLSAHLATLVARGGGLGGTGAVQSESLGDAAVSYAVSVAYQSHSYDATVWGKEYQTMRDGLGVRTIVT